MLERMRNAEEQKIYLHREILRLGELVEAARFTSRDVSLYRALIVQHCATLTELQISEQSTPAKSFGRPSVSRTR
jgi:hypothetical protein